MSVFRDCLLQLGLFDLRYQGPQFTWSNKQPTNPIAEKLDRVLVDSSWISMFPNSTTTFLAPNLSDHCPASLDLSYQLPKTRTRPFKFFNYLTKHPNFLSVVKDAWFQAGSNGSDLANLCWKQRLIKRDLKQLNRENFSQIQERVSEANSLIQVVQVQALLTPSPLLFRQERDLHIKWNFLRSIEESYFNQKSRINWLKVGDLNTSYFHRISQVKAAYNSIRSFLLDSGALVTDPVAMSALSISHFSSILAPEILPPLSVYIAWFQDLSDFRCSVTHQEAMQVIPSSAEITRVMQKMNPNKAPGPDGLSSGFYKAAWDIVGAEGLEAIGQFFVSSFISASTNATILALVPKMPGASMISHYRPVSCCNTLYKVISRLLVTKLNISCRNYFCLIRQLF